LSAPLSAGLQAYLVGGENPRPDFCFYSLSLSWDCQIPLFFIFHNAAGFDNPAKRKTTKENYETQ
jgi:hypothetical protein